MTSKVLFQLGILLIYAGCHQKKNQMETSTPTEAITTSDPHSFSKPDEAVVKHLDLDLIVDFDKKILSGSATIDVELKNNATQILLDTRDLTIEKVEADGKPTHFSLGKSDPILGSPLAINLFPATKQVKIYYATSKNAAAVQWLTPAQTAGKKFPFLFTQSQAILARTWVPIQDSPGIRFTYSATVKVPKELMALMSAENPQQKKSGWDLPFQHAATCSCLPACAFSW
jgi:aminopeptidase N